MKYFKKMQKMILKVLKRVSAVQCTIGKREMAAASLSTPHWNATATPPSGSLSIRKFVEVQLISDLRSAVRIACSVCSTKSFLCWTKYKLVYPTRWFIIQKSKGLFIDNLLSQLVRNRKKIKWRANHKIHSQVMVWDRWKQQCSFERWILNCTHDPWVKNNINT